MNKFEIIALVFQGFFSGVLFLVFPASIILLLPRFLISIFRNISLSADRKRVMKVYLKENYISSFRKYISLQILIYLAIITYYKFENNVFSFSFLEKYQEIIQFDQTPYYYAGMLIALLLTFLFTIARWSVYGGFLNFRPDFSDFEKNYKKQNKKLKKTKKKIKNIRNEEVQNKTKQLKIIKIPSIENYPQYKRALEAINRSHKKDDRMAVLNEINDSVLLGWMAAKTTDHKIRIRAYEKITTAMGFASFISNADSTITTYINKKPLKLTEDAMTHITNTDKEALFMVAVKSSTYGEEVCRRINDQKLLHDIVLSANSYDSQLAALIRIRDKELLKSIKLNVNVNHDKIINLSGILMEEDERMFGIRNEEDQVKLNELLLNGETEKIRIIAAEKVKSSDILAQAALNDQSDLVRRVVSRMISCDKVLIEIVENDTCTDVKEAAAENIRDKETLEKLVRNSTHSAVRNAALNYGSSKDLLSFVYYNDEDIFVRKKAISHIEDLSILTEAALKDESTSIRLAAIEKIDNNRILWEINRQNKSSMIGDAAWKKLPLEIINTKKRCVSCNNEVYPLSKIGDSCPHCNAVWGDMIDNN